MITRGIQILPRRLLAIALIVIGVGVQNASWAADTIERTGDVIQVLLPTAAFGATYYMDDLPGRGQFYKSFLTTFAVTHSLKYLIDKKRPDGGDHAFPSGHTGAAFQGAAFIQRRYGWVYGLPAYLGASFVGYSRIHADKHDLTDVLAGATLGIVTNILFTTTYNSYSVTPSVNDGVYGAMIRIRW
ncbi:phosphatase PAP2 family protein [Rhodospirillaceae bacterium SYSU D60014]|uniref:phosphatase PAP2 family protein n=1 Tax=Virgifigura deserti TaxID=2268457 RepID=UPI000E66413A